MSKRKATVLAPLDLGASGTYPISLNIQDVISRLTFTWKVTVATVSVMLFPILRCIGKVELVDGSDVLFSLSGEEIQALNYYNNKGMPYMSNSLTVGGFEIAEFSIDFGRYLWDKKYAFDPKKFNSPQLRITWDEDAANTAAVVNSLSIYASIFDGEDVQPVGFLQAKEVHQYAMAASAHAYIDLPADYPYRAIMLRPYTEARDVISQLDTVKLSINTDKRVLLNQKMDDYIWAMIRNYPRINERHILDAVVTAKTLFASPGMDTQIMLNYDGTAFVTAQSKFAVPTITGGKIVLAASVDIKALHANVHGYCPSCAIYIPLGDDAEDDSWFVPDPSDKILLDILSTSAATASDSHTTVIQQARLY